MKYHCTKRPLQDLSLDDNFLKFIKVVNLGKLKKKLLLHFDDMLIDVHILRYSAANVWLGCHLAHYSRRICQYR